MDTHFPVFIRHDNEDMHSLLLWALCTCIDPSIRLVFVCQGVRPVVSRTHWVPSNGHWAIHPIDCQRFVAMLSQYMDTRVTCHMSYGCGSRPSMRPQVAPPLSLSPFAHFCCCAERLFQVLNKIIQFFVKEKKKTKITNISGVVTLSTASTVGQFSFE